MSDTSEQFNIHEAKTQLSRIVNRAEHGDEIVLSRAGEPVAKIVPLQRGVHRTARGSLRGKLVLTDDWDSRAVNAEIARDFGSLP